MFEKRKHTPTNGHRKELIRLQSSVTAATFPDLSCTFPFSGGTLSIFCTFPRCIWYRVGPFRDTPKTYFPSSVCFGKEDSGKVIRNETPTFDVPVDP
ncbi:Hypothetical protein NTJ_07152 [Nesidiocoris tenuis]|uniref:Uncharacterized protein n=1 Tax=Nesidiocoris tenuis TaxID=355587 RepID=A0ABN7AQY6_9HEMI|nr:Hypothetical protein NTJ_07152 [Nesidiocoris tenuis]